MTNSASSARDDILLLSSSPSIACQRMPGAALTSLNSIFVLMTLWLLFSTLTDLARGSKSKTTSEPVERGMLSESLMIF